MINTVTIGLYPKLPKRETAGKRFSMTETKDPRSMTLTPMITSNKIFAAENRRSTPAEGTYGAYGYEDKLRQKASVVGDSVLPLQLPPTRIKQFNIAEQHRQLAATQPKTPGKLITGVITRHRQKQPT